MKPAALALENGLVFHGYACGAEGEAGGEVVFNTAMTGYQEVLTDPSYRGQIVTMTYPQMGNYGVNTADAESRKPFLSGFVVRELARRHSNWRADDNLAGFLNEHGIVALEGIDSRRAAALRVVLDLDQMDEERLEAIREYLLEHPGEMPVRFELLRRGRFRARLVPPPALTVWMSTIGSRTGRPATRRSTVSSDSPPPSASRKVSQLVPPMSKQNMSFISNIRP